MNKQIILPLFLLTSVLLIAACQLYEGKIAVEANEKRTEKAPIQNVTNSKKGVMLTVEKELYSTSETEITFMIINESDFELTYAEPFAIEKISMALGILFPFK